MPEDTSKQSPAPANEPSRESQSVDVSSFGGVIVSTGSAVSHPAPRAEAE